MYRTKQIILCLFLLIFAAAFHGCSKKNEISDSPTYETTLSTEDSINQVDIINKDKTTFPENTEVMEILEPLETSDASEVTETVQTEAAETVQMETAALEDVSLQEYIPFGQLIEPKYTDFVNVTWYIPDIQVELRYAGTDNFTKEQIYGFQDAYLRHGTVMKLAKVCEELKEHGVYLKIWDAFRPASAQFKLWEICPDPRYVADPNRGYSSHTRGNTVDVTLVDADGNELTMPSEFDDFSDAANRDYQSCVEEARQNAILLESVMEKHGFHGYWGEWWHFSDGMQYDVEKVFDPTVISEWYPNCKEFITLRTRASGWSDPLNYIPLGSPMTVLGYTGQFAMVEYMGERGYVLTSYIKAEP